MEQFDIPSVVIVSLELTFSFAWLYSVKSYLLDLWRIFRLAKIKTRE